jgi:hypothetical protein
MKEWPKFVTQEALCEHQIDMRHRVDLAPRDVGFCDLPVRDCAISTGGAPQAGIVVLRLALDALADHYEKSKRVGQSLVDVGEVTALKE